MISMKKILFLVYLIFIAYKLIAQDGAPLLTNFKESTEIENQNWAICQDDQNVMLFANRRGILSFDGQSWNFIPVLSVPYSLAYNPELKRVYVGGDDNYGYLARDEKGVYKYFSISGDSSSTGIISKIIFTDTTVYFYGEHTISRHNLVSGKLELRLKQKGEEPFAGMFITPKNTFINVLSQGLYRLESDTLFPIVTGYMSKDDEILFSLPYNKNLVLVGKSNGELLLFDGIKYYEYQIKDEDYLRQNILSEGLSISDSLYAFSTLEGGALVVDRKSGTLKHIINYSNGLPDDEIFALGMDNNHGLWLSHQYGITRADLRLPVANFSIYPGLRGNIISSMWINNELYVATSEGVYYLTEIKNYADVEVLVKDERASALYENSAARSMPVPLQVTEPQKTRKSIFSQLFGKKTVSEPLIAQSNKEKEVQSITPPILRLPEPKHFKKIAGRLKSVNYVYRKIDGLNEKCKQLVPAGKEILVSTNKGLFSISGHLARAIVKNGYINCISVKSEDNKYFVGTNDGYFYVSAGKDGKWILTFPDKAFNRPVYTIVSAGVNTLWAGSDGVAFRIKYNEGVPSGIPEKYTIANDILQRYIVDLVNDTIFLFTYTRVSFYDSGLNAFVEYKKGFKSNGSKLKYVFSQPESPWLNAENEWVNIGSGNNIDNNDKALLKIFDNISSIYTGKDHIWIVTGDNQLFRILRNRISSVKPGVGLFIRSISSAKGRYFKLSDIVFGSDDNTVYFDPVSPGYIKQNSTQYQYIVEKEMTEWTKWTYNSTISMMIKPGKYTLLVRAKDIWGNISEPQIVHFTIEAPFTKSTYFYFVILSVSVLLIIGIINFREKQLRKDKRILEMKVNERTAKIEAQKQEITSSIEYASRIQMAMLPENRLFGNSFSDYFIIFKPRDIVSGDFYWIGENEKSIFFTVADCTGHGVPGAFMSTLGISTLDEIITNNTKLKANTVLNLLREKIKTSLHQTGKDGEATDGMDVAFCILHKDRKTLEFAGAYNSMFIFQGEEFREYRADRMPIGIYYGEKETFTNYEVDIRPGDIVYIFSDGFADQSGGPKGSKYMKYNLKRLLSDIHYKPMDEQRRILETEFEKWKGSSSQIDDVTILGVRI
jgi:serine phosphatase RsbU (regulator of sigma subunit)/ligand-binding sensor domain-containing protein